MSAILDALEDLASDNITAWFRLSAISQAVLFYATPFLRARYNFIDKNTPLDSVSDSEWDTIQAYVDGLLYEAKNPMIGMIFPLVTLDPPPNVLPCDGSTYLRADFPELFAVLDTPFIVDADHFTVPDLRGKTIIGAGGVYNNADTGGEESHTLDVSEMPSHSHTIPLTTTTLAVEPGEVTVLTPIPILTANTGDTGGGGAHNNMQPFFALNYGIVAS